MWKSGASRADRKRGEKKARKGEEREGLRLPSKRRRISNRCGREVAGGACPQRRKLRQKGRKEKGGAKVAVWWRKAKLAGLKKNL